MRLNSPQYLEECTKSAATDIPLSLDERVVYDPQAQLIGYISATEVEVSPLERVPSEFRQFLDIMSKDAADALPQH